MSSVTTRPAGQARLLTLLLLGNTAMFAIYMGVGGPLVQSAIEAVDPANKISNAGLVAGVSAIFATLFNPIGGALSDRTHSRWGRRNPWMIGGALAAFASLTFLGSASTITMILIGWSLAQAMMNLFQAAITAIIPDRVPRDRRGTASAVTGVATSLGAIIGTQVAAQYIGSQTGFMILGGMVVVASILIALFTHDPRPGEYEVVVKPKRSPLAGFADFVSALSHRDFMWVFIGRALMMLAFMMVLLFQLFILQDHVGLGKDAPQAVATMTLVNTLFSVIAIVIGGPLADRLGRYRVFVMVSGIVAALSFLIPVISPTWPMMLVFTAVLGFAFGIYMAVDTALVTLVLPNPANAARDMGVLNIANAGPQMIAPFIAATIIGLGGYPALFIVGMVIALLGAVTVLPIKSVR